MSEEPLGKVTDFFWKRETVRIEVLNGSIEEGDELHITGEHTDETVTAQDMEVDDEPTEVAEEGEILAMPLGMSQRVVLGDEVYLVEDD